MLSGRGLCDELITRPEESYRLCCVVVCDLETSRMGAPYIYIYIYVYIYDISRLRVKDLSTFIISRSVLLSVGNVSDKICAKTRTYILSSVSFCSENLAVYEIMWKETIQPRRSHMTI